jgi:hypothetical protein
MANLSGFNAGDVTPSSPRDLLPANKYVAVIIHSEDKATRAGTGSYLELTFEIIDGPYTGRTLKARLNLDNPSDKAREIARAELSALCRAVGVLKPEDSADLHQIPLFIHVRQTKRQDNGELTNEIGGYSRRECAQPATPPANGTTSTGENKTTTPPWKR